MQTNKQQQNSNSKLKKKKPIKKYKILNAIFDQRPDGDTAW